MHIHVHSDASIIGGEGRGCFIVVATKGQKKNTKEVSRIIKRTPIVKTTNVADLEKLSGIQGLLFAMREFPEERVFTLHSDCMGVVDMINSSWLVMLRSDINPHFQCLIEAVKVRKILPSIYAEHVPAHKGTLNSPARRYNFMCDVLCSVKSK